MEIVDLQVIPFYVPRKPFSKGRVLPERRVVNTLTKILTDPRERVWQPANPGFHQ